jgi:S-formylglutathione hydrolase FrmB
MGLVKMNFLSETLGLPVNITVILPTYNFGDPAGSAAQYYIPGMKFQTIWLLHGGSGDDCDWVNYTSVLRHAEANKVAVVMAGAHNSFYVDMAHGGKYFTFFTEELPRVCQAMFPLSGKREDNFVAGLSMGGNGAMRMALKRPDLYNTALCMSGVTPTPREITDPDGMFRGKRPGPAMTTLMEDIYGDLSKLEGSDEDMYKVASQNVLEGKQLPNFLFGCGDKDFALPGVQYAYEFLKNLGYNTSLEIIPGYAHEWDFWDLYVRKAICELLPLKRQPLV